ncbi:MAG: hypothetical protein EA400_08500 [Chromatiaceae bacterium]|nr:MAG: hypothetical protein EA400_08500 [Chromatiaceae bacterium]
MPSPPAQSLLSVRSLLVALLLPVLLSGPGGCGRIKEDRKANALEAVTRTYAEAIRWGYYPAAVGFLSPEVRGDVDLEALKNIRVTGYEVIQPPVIDPDDAAVQLVQVDYVLNDRQVLRSLTDRQVWRWNEAGASWWLQTSLPAFVGSGPE